MKILITGGTGLIGTALISQLQQANQSQIYLLTRSIKNAENKLKRAKLATNDACPIKLISQLPNAEQFDFDIIINLAGEAIADKRWTNQQKQKIIQSRWLLTQQIVDKIQQNQHKPTIFISGSAIGFYGQHNQEVKLTEDYQITDSNQQEFPHQVCQTWEQIALSAVSEHTRVCIIRTGIVLAKQGGALSKMLPPYYIGLGGPLGDGTQMMSWISLTDEINAILHLINTPSCHGIFNLTAPNPVSNNDFSQCLAASLNRPNKIRVPSFILKLLLGEMSQLVLTGQTVYPANLLDSGFKFSHPHLTSALNSILKPTIR